MAASDSTRLLSSGSSRLQSAASINHGNIGNGPLPLLMLMLMVLGVGLQLSKESVFFAKTTDVSVMLGLAPLESAPVGAQRRRSRKEAESWSNRINGVREDEDEKYEPVSAPLLDAVEKNNWDKSVDIVDHFDQLRLEGNVSRAGLANVGAGDADSSKPSLLPRTGTVEYNVGRLGEKYMLYSPSGGFNNQLACLLSASYMAKQYNRTLIVPANGRHSSMAWGYYALKQSDITPMDHALDFAFMGEKLGVRMMPLNVTIKDFHKRYLFARRRESNEYLDVIHAPKRAGFYNSPPSVLKKYLKMGHWAKRQYLWFEGRFYTKYWALKNHLYKYIRYSPYLRHLSTNIAREMFQNSTFNAFHIRMGDYSKYLKAESQNSASYVNAAKKYGFGRETPVYVATDGRKSHKYFKALKSHFPNIVFQTDLADNPVVRRWIQDFNRRVPKNARNDLFGLVEQMICVQARNYVGTAVSTFSQTIAKTRRAVRNAMPEIDAHNVKVSALIHWDGKLSYLKRNPDSAEDSI